MKFSQEPPKEPGVYWFRLTEDSGVHHTRVWRQEWDGKLVTASGDGVAMDVERFGRWWSTDFLREPDEH